MFKAESVISFKFFQTPVAGMQNQGIDRVVEINHTCSVIEPAFYLYGSAELKTFYKAELVRRDDIIFLEKLPLFFK